MNESGEVRVAHLSKTTKGGAASAIMVPTETKGGPAPSALSKIPISRAKNAREMGHPAMEDLMWIGSGHCYRSHQLSIHGMQVRLFVGGLIWQLSSFRYFVLDLLFGQDGGEVFHLKDLADFDFVVVGAAVGATLDPLDGLFEGLDLQDREASDELLGLGEGAVDDGTRLAGEFDPCAFGAGMEAIEGEQDSSLDELFVVLAHLDQELWIGEGAFFF